jgi:hypothetical protein
VGSWIAGVGAELDRGRLVTRYLGRAGCLSTPTGVWIKRGAKSPVGFGPGSDSRRGHVSLVRERCVLPEDWGLRPSIHATKSNLSPQHTSNGSLRSKRAFSAVNLFPLYAAQAGAFLEN